MQRWIVIGVVLVAVLLGGGIYGYKTYQANLPGGIWVPIPIPVDMTREVRESERERFYRLATDDELVLTVATELKLAREWSLATDEQAAAELKRRVFVRPGNTGPKLGNQPSLNIGVHGKRKEVAVTTRIVKRMMEGLKQSIRDGSGRK